MQDLEVISDELNSGVKITTNWARHSWATIARNKANVPKADIDFCLGHVNNDHKNKEHFCYKLKLESL